jgi:hypothetical protein
MEKRHCRFVVSRICFPMLDTRLSYNNFSNLFKLLQLQIIKRTFDIHSVVIGHTYFSSFGRHHLTEHAKNDPKNNRHPPPFPSFKLACRLFLNIAIRKPKKCLLHIYMLPVSSCIKRIPFIFNGR